MCLLKVSALNLPYISGYYFLDVSARTEYKNISKKRALLYSIYDIYGKIGVAVLSNGF